MPYDYPWEKLYDAVRCLAGSGTLQNRVNNALLCFHTLKVHGIGLPASIKSRLDQLWAAFETATPVGDEGQWRASINAMTEDELSDRAMDIVSIYDAICRHQEPHDE